MVDAVVSMVLERLVPIIETRAREQVCLLTNSTDDQINKLASKLKRIQQVLRDAERKGVTDPRVKSWLHKLLEISYDMDDVLDEWDWENIRQEMEDTSSDSWNKVKYFIKYVPLCFKNVFKRRKINSNIKQLNDRLDRIGQENENEFKFVPNLGYDHSRDFKRIETASLVNVSEIHGRDDDKENLVSKLLCESSSSCSPQTKSDIPIISIVGAGGMGKTTIAQLVFNDQRVEDHFQEKIWVCVSDPFDVIKVATSILKALDKDSTNLSQLETLLQRIVHNVSAKSFLLVLDDVWTEDDTMWKPLREALKHGAPNSRILVTTRKKKAAQVMGSTSMQIQSLNPLSDLNCWRVLSQIAFRERSEHECIILKDIGLKIVKKCKGLPLAATTIGSLLRFKSSVEEWQEVLESPWWEIEEVQKDIFAPLALSYDELHPVAKRCFSYCAIFPKDTKLESDTLIRIWCAQGFLCSITKSSDDDVEQKGRRIFDDLAMRSLFQDFERDYVGNHIMSCKMHDIVHDFAQFLSKNECKIVENVNGGATSAYTRSTRHLNLLVEKYNTNINYVLTNSEKCRSFFTSKHNIPADLFRYLKKVRVLVLHNCLSEVILSGIGSLIHLKYLDLSWSLVTELPEAICDLYNLVTLILENCQFLSAFPQGIHKLRKLRNIVNDVTGNIEFPEGIEELTNLRTLSEIRASSRRNWKNLEFLRNMNKLGGSLTIFVEGLEKEDAHKRHLLVAAVEKAELKNKKLVRKLKILWYKGKIPFQVVEALQPHPNLEILEFDGPCLPKWITTLTNLRRLTIQISEDGDDESEMEMASFSSLLALGKLLPFLEYLWLKNIRGIRTPNPEELYTTFPKLKSLVFSSCWEWEEWEDISEEQENNINLSIFPSLELLEFYHCPKLNALPHRLLRKAASLKDLEICYCHKLEERYNDWERVSQIHGISHITPKIG